MSQTKAQPKYRAPSKPKHDYSSTDGLTAAYLSMGFSTEEARRIAQLASKQKLF